MQRYLFNSHVRKQGESVAIYIAEVKCQSEHCECAGILEDMLCDRLVCGISDLGICSNCYLHLFQTLICLGIPSQHTPKMAHFLKIKHQHAHPPHVVYSRAYTVYSNTADL